MKLAIVDSTNCSEIKLESYLTETPDEILIRDSRIFSKIRTIHFSEVHMDTCQYVQSVKD